MTIVGVACWGRSTLAATPSYCAAHLHPGEHGPLLSLFPLSGHELNVVLPSDLPKTLTVNSFGPDGKAIYVQNAPDTQKGILEIKFGPVRQNTIPGSAGLGTIWHLTTSRESGRIFVSGLSPTRGECGTFEIEPNAGRIRTVLAGAFPTCGGGGGAVSPDGKRILTYTGNELGLLELKTGSVHVIKSAGRIGLKEVTWGRDVTWSPDGRWISVVDHDKITLIDPTDPSHSKRIGTSKVGVVWSPDSKYLLIEKSELRCAAFLNFESLEILEVATGKRTMIESSRCSVGPGWLGWMDSDILK